MFVISSDIGKQAVPSLLLGYFSKNLIPALRSDSLHRNPSIAPGHNEHAGIRVRRPCMPEEVINIHLGPAFSRLIIPNARENASLALVERCRQIPPDQYRPDDASVT